MSAQTIPAPGLRSAFAQVPAVAAAVAGRRGQRLWWPLVIYFASAEIGWLWLSFITPAPAGTRTWYTELPSGILLLASVAAVPVLWAWGARFALALGLDRGVVFATTFGLSLLVPAGLHLVSQVCNQIELRLIGTGGIHVFTIEGPDSPTKFGTNETVFNWTWQLLFENLVPGLVLLVIITCAALRWGLAGGLLGALGAFAASAALLAGISAIGQILGSAQDAWWRVAWLIVVVAGGLAAARIFSRVRA